MNTTHVFMQLYVNHINTCAPRIYILQKAIIETLTRQSANLLFRSNAKAI